MRLYAATTVPKVIGKPKIRSPGMFSSRRFVQLRFPSSQAKHTILKAFQVSWRAWSSKNVRLPSILQSRCSAKHVESPPLAGVCLGDPPGWSELKVNCRVMGLRGHLTQVLHPARVVDECCRAPGCPGQQAGRGWQGLTFFH